MTKKIASSNTKYQLFTGFIITASIAFIAVAAGNILTHSNLLLGSKATTKAKLGINYWPSNSSYYMQFLNEWPKAKPEVDSDLKSIKAAGFGVIRILISPQHYGDTYMSWGTGARKFFFQNQSTTSDAFSVTTPFSPPTSTQMKNLDEYIQVIKQNGMDYELILALQAPVANQPSKFYFYKETNAHYQAYLSPFFELVKRTPPFRFYIAGDFDPANNADHALWLKSIWPHITQNCPLSTCRIGLEVGSANSTFWDNAVKNINWVKQNVSPLPTHVGVQMYPTTRPVLCQLNFVTSKPEGKSCESLTRNDVITVDWLKVFSTHWNAVTAAAGSSFNVELDEIGMTTAATNDGFTETDQLIFFQTAIPFYLEKTGSINLWTFKDNAASGSSTEDFFGLVKKDNRPKPSFDFIKRYTSLQTNSCNSFIPLSLPKQLISAPPNSSITVSCPLGTMADNSLPDCVTIDSAASGLSNCIYISQDNTAVKFSCQTPAVAKSYPIKCTTFASSSKKCCPAEMEVGTLTVTATAACQTMSLKSTPFSITAKVGASYDINCDYGTLPNNVVPDCISVSQNQNIKGCQFVGGDGSVVRFRCAAPTTTGTYPISCATFANTKSNCCSQSNPAGTLTVIP